MNININNGITVSVKLIAKKSKTTESQYCIYIGFYTYQNGVKHAYHSISTGITTKTESWKNGEIIGRNDKAKFQNERLNDYLSRAKDLLIKLSLKSLRTCGEVLNEIKFNAKQLITGKAPRGFKKAFISKMKDYTYSQILALYLEEKQVSGSRKRNYIHTVNLLDEYFQKNTPNVDLITSQDLEGVKKMVAKKYENQNTATTFLAQIAAVLKFALKLKVITVNPIPDNFRGSFKDGKREILSESDCLKIMELNDDLLSQTEKVAKYCLLSQLLTGMAYVDLKSLGSENIKYDETSKQYVIEKERCKTKKKFVVNLTSNALNSIKMLSELTSTEAKSFTLPSIEYISRMYKKIGEMAGVKTKITTYTMRHTFAVNYMENDGRLEDLQVRLGHTDIKTTQIYGKISKKRNADTTNLLESKSRIHQIHTSNLKAV